MLRSKALIGPIGGVLATVAVAVGAFWSFLGDTFSPCSNNHGSAMACTAKSSDMADEPAGGERQPGSQLPSTVIASPIVARLSARSTVMATARAAT
jgi:hypothetical protein